MLANVAVRIVCLDLLKKESNNVDKLRLIRVATIELMILRCGPSERLK